jgi:hypothetical protein
MIKFIDGGTLSSVVKPSNIAKYLLNFLTYQKLSSKFDSLNLYLCNRINVITNKWSTLDGELEGVCEPIPINVITNKWSTHTDLNSYNWRPQALEVPKYAQFAK